MAAQYDTIGRGYAALRRPEARIAAPIHAALESARTVLNVGAGAGSYEPEGRAVTAIDPSARMIAQRPPSGTVVVQGHAEDLPFADDAFDGAMAVLTVHHWTDKARGVAEMRRVARGPVVILTYDPAFRDFWLFDYFPEIAALDEGQMPPMDAFGQWFGLVEIRPVPIPQDCTDGFLAAYWRRPAAYLDPHVRGTMSSFWKIGDVTAGLDRLRSDIETGEWTRRHGDLRDLDRRDCGYRLIVTR
ncbi:hypothetical protein OCGS_0957 [Oceaniovalibus guishaninsula JLT2003]|uniref:Methyltransferase type 11 domain-containing protein n=1 Tax=Oceaniovalibus guishaninsula JLT2003 TaxID=1231392 RepID=K2HEG0_9RHOB|nr:class I SAM-dependent methyltransferase [Oceaniovalibus guishaninsula]EKE44922.1 hypothetical protein OCGS_0957 [Oceaniovalibus guishaninsula JLT2003]